MSQNNFLKMTELSVNVAELSVNLAELSVNAVEFWFFERLLLLSRVKHDSVKF
jgi:uncharacterized membrane protein